MDKKLEKVSCYRDSFVVDNSNHSLKIPMETVDERFIFTLDEHLARNRKKISHP